MDNVTVYTDGSLNREAQLLTSSFWVESENYGRTMRRREVDPTRCTNIRAELEAIAWAVHSCLAPDVHLTIKTDCQCLVRAWDGITRRMVASTKYAHTDLWDSITAMLLLCTNSELTLEWVRGHATTTGNILVDKACRQWGESTTEAWVEGEWHWSAVDSVPTLLTTSLHSL